MAFDSEKFIIDLAKQLNLNNMDDATYARWKDLQKKGVLTSKQKKWDPRKPVPTITAEYEDTSVTPPVRRYVYTDEVVGTAPAPNAADLQDLYLKLVVILRDVAAEKKYKDDDKVKKFLDKFYGPGKAIEPYNSKPVPATYPVNDIATYIDTNKSRITMTVGISEADLSRLSSALLDGSYRTNAKILDIFQRFIAKVSEDYYDGKTPLPGAVPSGLQDTDQLSEIYQAIRTPETPTPTQLAQLFGGMEPMFGKLVSDDKLREKVLAKDTDGDITGWVDKALGETNYKDGDHKLTPLYTDRKRWFQEATDNIKKKYKDTAGKLEQKHTRHIYSTNARFIVDELIKKGVKPTDGMEKLLSTMGSISGNLPNPVQKQMKWVSDTLGKLSGQTFFKEALEDGDQMRQLVQEIIVAAVHDDKKEEAKVALEMLSVMRYTMTTSSVRDKLKKTDFTVFSDKGLSFNKNEYVQMFTRATDKLVKAMAMGVFELGNLAKNAIKTNGVKFGKGTGRLDKRTTDSHEYSDPDKRNTMEELFAFWDFVNSSEQSKDYNIFVSHKDVVQKGADTKTGRATASVTTAAGTTYSIDDPTAQQERFLEFLRRNNIGRS